MNQTTSNTDAIIRNPYVTPLLVAYGNVNTLTRGGNATSGEGDPRFDKVKKS